MIVGRLGRAHGIDGSLVLHLETDYFDRFAPGSVLTTETGVRLTVDRFRQTTDQALISFVEAGDRSAAENLAGAILTIEAGSRRPLDEGEFWPDELEGLEVRDPRGQVLGRVVAVEQETAQDRLVIKDDGVTFQVPLVKELVPRVEVEAGYLVVVPIPGLFTPPSAE